MKKRFEIEVDLDKKILRFKAWGFWSKKEGKLFYEEYLAKSKPLINDKWVVLADISEFGIQKKEVQAVNIDLMKYSAANGMVKAANLISRLLNQIQIEKLFKESKFPSHAFFKSKDDAEKWLFE